MQCSRSSYNVWWNDIKNIGTSSRCLGYYMDMFEKVLETGNSAEAMVRKVKINDDISNEDVVEAMQSIAEEI